MPNSSRRQFLTTSLAASAATMIAAPLFVSTRALGREGIIPPSDTINLGVIGIGPRGTYDLAAMLKQPDVRCVAIADVQASRREAGKKLVDGHYGDSECQIYRDFREVLDRKDIHAVLIATGDRWHARASILAAKAGKDVYSEKPCGITISDCQEIEAVFQREKRVFQAGTQRRSVPNFQAAVQLAHGGKLGKLQTLYASVYQPALDNNWLPAEPSPPADVCDWNLWLGPAPWRPYNSRYVAGGWRGIHDFDSGAKLLDWGAHTVDQCQWANQVDNTLPLTYTPTEKSITCAYANGVKLVLDFLQTPFGQRPGWIQKLGTCPVRFVGESGWVETGDSGDIEVSDDALRANLPAREGKVVGLDVSAHARNFFDAVKSRGTTAANPSVMKHSHVACHAAALAWMLQRELTINPETVEFVNDAEANSLRSRPERVY
ncbi:MAG: Gfo/Idh/MocA family oxidoreductase [Pirellulales bacterium]|nr:Gfo/Idh/MocA family oxidoreductase [Pirellulales bacterium]